MGGIGPRGRLILQGRIRCEAAVWFFRAMRSVSLTGGRHLDTLQGKL